MSNRPERRNFAPLALGVLLGATALCLAACGKPLLAEEDERSPFDRYDGIRNQYAQQYIEDEYGRKRPNLRGRLTPKP